MTKAKQKMWEIKTVEGSFVCDATKEALADSVQHMLAPLREGRAVTITPIRLPANTKFAEFDGDL